MKQWTREEYDRLIEAGVLSPEERVELLEGDIVRVPPPSPARSVAISSAVDLLREIFQDGFDVRIRVPLATDDGSEPEPDVAVVRGHRRDCIQAHPSTAVLLVEISDTTLDYDRRRKGPAYARANVCDYWIVNLVDRQVEVYRHPTPDRGYRAVSRFRPGETIAPLGAPLTEIAVNDLLP